MKMFYFQLSNQYSCLIWTTTPGKAKYLKDLADDSFVDEVNDAFVCVSVNNFHREKFKYMYVKSLYMYQLLHLIRKNVLFQWHERDKNSTVMSLSHKYQEILNFVFTGKLCNSQFYGTFYYIKTILFSSYLN